MIIKKHPAVSYPNEWALIDDLFATTGKFPLALFRSGSVAGVPRYVLVYGYKAVSLLRELPTTVNWFKAQLIKLGLVKAPVPELEPVFRQVTAHAVLENGVEIEMVEFYDLLKRLLDNDTTAHIQVSGLNVSSDLWTEGAHADDTEYGVLYDYVSRGIQELANEWIMPVSMEYKLIQLVEQCKKNLTKAIAQDNDFQQEAYLYAKETYRVRNYRFANVLHVDVDNLVPDWLPGPVFGEIKRHLTKEWPDTPGNKPVVPSGEFNHFTESLIEMGPEDLRGMPKAPSTIRPEKKLSNFVDAVTDKLELLTADH